MVKCSLHEVQPPNDGRIVPLLRMIVESSRFLTTVLAGEPPISHEGMTRAEAVLMKRAARGYGESIIIYRIMKDVGLFSDIG